MGMREEGQSRMISSGVLYLGTLKKQISFMGKSVEQGGSKFSSGNAEWVIWGDIHVKYCICKCEAQNYV